MAREPIKLEALPAPRLEIINLIDVLITLIAFFMLTSVFAGEQRELGIRLPQANQAAARREPVNLIIEVNRDNRIFWEGRPIKQEELIRVFQGRTPETAVIIRADRDCNYGTVVKLLDLAKTTGLNKVAFETGSSK